MSNITPHDFVIAVDTDSNYISIKPLIDAAQPENPLDFTVALANDLESYLNKMYDVMAKRLFNCDSHRLSIKGESVAETAFWVAKKNYALKKVYDLEVGIPVEYKKPKVTGIAVVRSSFPPAFASAMEEMLKMILDKKEKEVVDKFILAFRDSIDEMHPFTLMPNTSVKRVDELDDPKEKSYHLYPKGAAAHFKAAIAYNRLLRANGWDKKYATIRSTDKIKWAPLKQNIYQMPTIGVKTYDDPPEVIDFLLEHIDRDEIFESVFAKKIQSFYDALGWGLIPTKVNQTALQFFSWE